MKRAIIYVVVAAVVLVGLGAAVVRLRQRAQQLAADLKIIDADTGDVMASATYQRFATRREAVVAMKQALLEVASIESVFVADSGRPITWLPPGGVKFDPTKIGVSIWLLRDRWVATAQTYGNFSTMTCMITAMVDSTTLDSIRWRYHAGAPRCAEVYFNDSVLALLPPPPPLPVTAPEAPASPLRAPRHHRDWGPVNNRPPSMPYIVHNACEGEGCARSGTWAACTDVAALREKRLGAPVVFTVHGGEKFTALTIDLHIEAPGMVVFRHPMSNRPAEANGVDSIAFTPADTLYLLNSHGEGYLVWWFRGQAGEGYQFWRDIDADEVTKYPADTAVLVRRPNTTRWVHARNAAGQEGWIVFDYQKMATGGYMDEIERCLKK
jgi:hypothetical protein